MFYIRVLEIPVCVLLLVQPSQRNQLCLMEFLIVSALNLRAICTETSGTGRDSMFLCTRYNLPVKRLTVN